MGGGAVEHVLLLFAQESTVTIALRYTDAQ
jgi:hypothetical protein